MTPLGKESWIDEPPTPPDAKLIQQIKDAVRSVTLDPWNSIGQQPLLRVWRINKFRAARWPEEEYGTFYNADVFIILNTRYKEVMSSVLIHDIHLWLGKNAHQNDVHAGIKLSLELDDKVQNAAVLHRQVSGREDNTFKQYFEILTVYRGSASTSFRYHPNDVHPAKLLRYYKPTSRSELYRVKEIAPSKSNLQSEYNYIMDIGKQLYMWTGNLTAVDEKLKAVKYCESIVAIRGMDTKLEVIDEDNSEEHYFHFYLQNNLEHLVDSDDETASNVSRQTTLKRHQGKAVNAYKLKVKNGEYYFDPYNESGVMKKKDLANLGMGIIDSGLNCFVWLGKKPQPAQRRNAIFSAHVYLHTTDHPLIPITVLKEGQNHPPFNRALSAF